jgi:GT2 family glycosyltransferase
MSDLNVLIATHNGSDVLARTLEGYAGLDVQNTDYKLIIVDNASTDTTKAIIDRFAPRLNIDTVFEPNPGKNHAMNTGLKAINAEIIVMSDDDSIPHPGFMQHWLQAFTDAPDIDLFGGSIIPLFDEEPASWMMLQQPRFEELFAQREDIPAGPISPDRIYGPNMAMRASVIRQGLQFDARVGPDASRKTSYAMGSETAFLRVAVQAGFKTGFAPAPTVSHIVRRAHIQPDYIAGRAYRMGRGAAFKHCEDGTFTLRRRPLPLRAIGKLKRTLDSQINQLRSNFGTDEQRFHARWNANFYRGYHDEIAERKAEKFRSTN